MLKTINIFVLFSVILNVFNYFLISKSKNANQNEAAFFLINLAK